MSLKLKYTNKEASSESVETKPTLTTIEGGKSEAGEKKKKKTNKYFYKVSNHHELYKIGMSFYKDFQNGVKSFAISSTGYQQAQQNSILGLASFFDHKQDLKILIVSDNLHNGAFKDVVGISKKDTFPVSDEASVKVSSFYGHFEFVDLEDLLSISNDGQVEAYEEVFDKIVDSYDIIFWDVPELHKIQMDSEKYFPMIMKFESLSIIVSKSLSSSKDIEDVKLFFLGYGISLKGLLLDSAEKVKAEDKESDDKKEKKKWWRFFK